MASLNLSINGPSIKSSYQSVVNAPAAPAGSSSTYAHWALFSVQAPLANAFQDSGSKESVLKVQSTGEGELDELIEDFNEGRIQFAFMKVKDPNSGLPKCALIAWCGGGVPERTKGYFTSHLSAVSKILHGYHVQITARSDSDVEPANILQKIADASGAKYTAGGSAPVKTGGAPPPVKSKPVFAAPSSSTISFNPIVAARNANLRQKTNDDGWGDDAPPVTRSEIQKVESAYKPTKVNMDELRNQKPGPSRVGGFNKQDDRPSDVVGGGYQPVGKVDIAAIRAAAREKQDDRPAPVKGAYEPVGKVDIAAIKARAQKPDEAPAPAAPSEDADSQPKSLAERSAAFSQSERITEMPKPKVANKFGGAPSFAGTKAPTPGALGLGGPSPAPAGAAPVGSASRTFADQGGKTPAQLWAEKKAAQGGAPKPSSPAVAPVEAQKSGGGWQSGYAGKSWAPVQAPGYGRGIPGQKTGDTVSSQDREAPASPSGSVGAIRDRFKDAPPPVAPAPAAPAVPHVSRAPAPVEEQDEPGPPPPPMGTRPVDNAAPSGGFELPGMPPRPPPPTDEEEEEAEPPSPPRVAMPVARGPEPEMEPPQEPPRSLPVRSLEQEVPKEEDLPQEDDAYDPRAAATHVAEQQFGHAAEPEPAAQGGAGAGARVAVLFDYERAEDNELELREGEFITVTNIEHPDWWEGMNDRGERGLFPSNYVEAPGADAPGADAEPEAPAAPAEVPSDRTATAEFDYEAAEDNELSFPEGAKITNLIIYENEEWWYGHYKGDQGLFPKDYVTLDP
ncbi:hypothetical protein F4780DRAFT_197998 [Xylariomycetidae sp. FL0641]|nr:hypothetical protein F4780DRAFT_197998 [Xylariomycetidae sp. FL0641]